MLAALPIGWRIHLTTLVAVIGLVVVGTLGAFDAARQQEDARRDVLKHVVESAVAIAASYHAEVQAGRLPQPEAQARAAAALRAIRYRGAEYIWVNDMTPRMVMHPFRPDLEGKEIGALADPNGFRLFEAVVATVRRDGAGVVPYLWPKPGSAQPVEKMSYVQGFAPWGWVIGSGLYIDDLHAAQRQRLIYEIVAVLTAALVVALFAAWIARDIVRPLRRITVATATLASGDLTIDVPGGDRRDELGVLARALDGFRQDGIAKRQLEAAAQAERTASDRRQVELDRHTADFGGSVSGVMRILSESATAIRQTAASVARAGRDTLDAARLSGEGAQESTASLSQVAAATEELSSSVDEIARQVAGAAEAAGKAVASAEATTVRIRGLSQAAAEIGNVVKLINEVAGRTNLLALNATIEAARAGDVGKGFAVVASEVKQLAEQTRRATEEISRQIGSIQAATGEAVSAVADVGEAIGHVNGIAAAIAAAVEQQGAATREIASQVNGVAARTIQANQDMATLGVLADDSMKAGESVLASADEVANVAQTLRTEVDLFLEGALNAGKNRRRHDRLAAGDVACQLLASGGREWAAQLRDIAIGGAGLGVAKSQGLIAGLGLVMTLPGEAAPVQARVARVERDLVAVVFLQDSETGAVVERVMARLGGALSNAA